jgi:hypothetical protein
MQVIPISLAVPAEPLANPVECEATHASHAQGLGAHHFGACATVVP